MLFNHNLNAVGRIIAEMKNQSVPYQTRHEDRDVLMHRSSTLYGNIVGLSMFVDPSIDISPVSKLRYDAKNYALNDKSSIDEITKDYNSVVSNLKRHVNARHNLSKIPLNA